jgi:CheY-like chemotaxis protein
MALREEQRRKDEFIALLGHELRGPLAPIRNVLALMRSDLADTPHRAHLAVINRQTGYMVRLIDDLLDLSRMARDQIRLKLQPFDLIQLVRAVADPERYFAANRPTAPLRFDTSTTTLMFDGDRDRIGQILGNLLSNARKFTPTQGSITLRVQVELHQVQITVSDTGIGIAAQDIARIFERFEQVQRPDGGHSGGLGLGLYLSRRLAELHGGRLEVESAGLGLGSSFHLTLPCRPVEQPVVPAQRVMPEATAPLRVLLVDDHRDTVDTMSTLLTVGGHTVQCAEDGLQGLAAAQSMRPDVVILDVDMPGIDGFEMTRRIRAEPWGRSMRLLALTGFSQPQHLATSREVGLDAHLTKPADLSRLRALLGEWSAPVQRL